MRAYFSITTTEWLALLFCISMVLAAELINTVIESVMDLYSKEQSALAKAAKDTAAAEVLIAAIFSAVIGSIIFFPKRNNAFLPLENFVRSKNLATDILPKLGS